MKRIDELKAGVAVIILNEENQVLLQKRADVGLQGIPSGHIEIGETVSEAAMREVKEETNLEIKIKKLIGVYSDPNSQVFTYPNGIVVHFITTCFLAEITGGELSVTDTISWQEMDGIRCPHFDEVNDQNKREVVSFPSFPLNIKL